jgi:hypothetical protein
LTPANQCQFADRIFGRSPLILHIRGFTCPAALPASSAPS